MRLLIVLMLLINFAGGVELFGLKVGKTKEEEVEGIRYRVGDGGGYFELGQGRPLEGVYAKVITRDGLRILAIFRDGVLFFIGASYIGKEVPAEMLKFIESVRDKTDPELTIFATADAQEFTELGFEVVETGAGRINEKEFVFIVVKNKEGVHVVITKVYDPYVLERVLK